MSDDDYLFQQLTGWFGKMIRPKLAYTLFKADEKKSDLYKPAIQYNNSATPR